MKKLKRITVIMLFFMVLSGCYLSKHYNDNPASMDGVFFNSYTGTPRSISGFETDDRWRNYYIWGLVPSSEGDVRFAANKTSNLIRGEARLHNLEIRTQKTFLNGLAEIGISLIPIFGIVQPFVFNYRSMEVKGQVVTY